MSIETTMTKMIDTLWPAKGLLRGLYRYLKGGEPIPEALDPMTEFLSGRDDLSRDDWIADALRGSTVRDEVAGFAYDFFADCQIPFGKVRIGDRLRQDLQFHEALQDDWDEYLADAFKERFKVSLTFKRTPRIETVVELLLFLQGTLDQRRHAPA